MAQGVLDQAVQQNIPSTPPLYSPPPGALGAQEASRVPRAELNSSGVEDIVAFSGVVGPS